MLRGITLALFLCLFSSVHALATDQDRVRDAVRAGQARPLAQILPRIQNQFPGQMLDARLEQGGGATRYVLKILGPSGQVSEVTVDAKSGAVLGVR